LKLETGNWGKTGGEGVKEVYELDVYRLAEKLSDLIWTAFDGWSEKVQRTIGYQVIRAADSVAVNLAGGYGRFTPADRKKFYLYARGSL
jgi:four helix bundle protein